MAGSFPTLKSGNTIWYPLSDTHSFGTGVCKFLDDSEQRWRARNMLRRLKLVCQDVNAYDTSLILKFWRSQFGRFDSTWSLAIAAETLLNLAFDSDSFQITENKRNRHTISFDVIQVKSALPTIPVASTVYFPQINGDGIMTGLPYTFAYDYKTTTIDLDNGIRQAWKWRTFPLARFAFHHPAITDAELDFVRDFFYAMEGRKGEFGVLDPGGNLVPYSDLFSNISWTKTSLTLGIAQDDPFNGSLATEVTSGGSNGRLSCTIIPAGNATGFLLTVSCWVRAVELSQQLSIGFLDDANVDLGHTVWDLPHFVWKRIYHTVTLATNNPIKVVIGGANTWGSTQVIHLFSAQAASLPAPGPRLLTPGFNGLRPKCRFDTDDFQFQRVQLGYNTVTLPMQEYK